MSLCRFDLCSLAADIISKEFNTPNFTQEGETKDFNRSRHLYTYFCFTELNAPQTLIRSTLRYYKYPKTVYQVLRRVYFKRKDQDLKTDLAYIKSRFHVELQRFEAQDIKPRKDGKQLRIWEGHPSTKN
jgi:hypothetical protein